MWQGCSAETRHPGYGDAEDTCPFVLWGVFDASSPTSADTANAPGSAQSILMSSTATHGPRSIYWRSSDSEYSAGDYCEEAIDFFLSYSLLPRVAWACPTSWRWRSSPSISLAQIGVSSRNGIDNTLSRLCGLGWRSWGSVFRFSGR